MSALRRASSSCSRRSCLKRRLSPSSRWFPTRSRCSSSCLLHCPPQLLSSAPTSSSRSSSSSLSIGDGGRGSWAGAFTHMTMLTTERSTSETGQTCGSITRPSLPIRSNSSCSTRSSTRCFRRHRCKRCFVVCFVQLHSLRARVAHNYLPPMLDIDPTGSRISRIDT